MLTCYDTSHEHLTFTIQGALSGFLVSFSYNMWIVIGKFIRGGGDPQKLPLSIATCEGSFNATLEDLVYTTMDASSLHSTPATTTLAIEEYVMSGIIYSTQYDNCRMKLWWLFLGTKEGEGVSSYHNGNSTQDWYQCCLQDALLRWKLLVIWLNKHIWKKNKWINKFCMALMDKKKKKKVKEESTELFKRVSTVRTIILVVEGISLNDRAAARLIPYRARKEEREIECSNTNGVLNAWYCKERGMKDGCRGLGEPKDGWRTCKTNRSSVLEECP